MKNFNDLGLAEPILRAVTGEGYTTPTPIQAQVIPAMLAGGDVLGTAQTGTGKTASFVLPLLHQIAAAGKDAPRPLPKSCGALILAPTRELAEQIAASIRTYSRFMRVSVTVVIGGAKAGPQIRAMSRGVDFLVATPGRLLDHMSTRAIVLDSTRTVVLDEGDQMLDLGFIPAIRKIMNRVPASRQTAMMSATMPPPIRALAQDFLKDPLEISVAPASRPIELIDQKVMHVDSATKRQVLVDILGGSDVNRAIVFTRTKRGADRVNLHLQNARLNAGAIHGNKSQGQRQRTLADFRSGKVNILVATDIAARGIDVDGVSHVVNFELPNVPEAYVHRIGRTARAGNSGIAISLCDSEERGLLRDIERLIGNRIAATDDQGRPMEPLPDVPANRRKPGRPGQAQRNRNRSFAGKPGGGGPRGEGKPGNGRPQGQPKAGPNGARRKNRRPAAQGNRAAI